MKNQYFADINDYRKFGILRSLAGNGALKTAICWMLTKNDHRRDGKFIGYLEHPDLWRKYDPELFDQLAACLSNPASRSVKWVDENRIVPAATCFSEFLEDDRKEFTQQLVEKFCEHLPLTEMVTFSTANVLFLLIPQPRHQQFLMDKCDQISKQWGSQIEVKRHACLAR
jgi:hypothetical protein